MEVNAVVVLFLLGRRLPLLYKRAQNVDCMAHIGSLEGFTGSAMTCQLGHFADALQGVVVGVKSSVYGFWDVFFVD